LQTLITADLTYSTDVNVYAAANSISCLLPHKVVKLGYFEFVQHWMNGIASGDPFIITPEGLAPIKV